MVKSYPNFLLEYQESNRNNTYILTEDEIVDLIKTECKDFRFSHKPIWRNTNQKDEYYLVDPSLYTRKSINVENYYTLVLDNSPSWSGFPKRSKSLIGMLDDHNDSFGGSQFRMIPFDGANIGVLDASDLWYSFGYLKSELSINIKHINEFIMSIKEHFNLPKIDDNNFQTFLKDLEPYENLLKNDDKFFSVLKYYEVYEKRYIPLLKTLNKNLKSGRNIVQILDKYLNPTSNKIKTVNYKELIELDSSENIWGGGREIWTDSKCLLIYIDDIDKIKTRLKLSLDYND